MVVVGTGACHFALALTYSRGRLDIFVDQRQRRTTSKPKKIEEL